MFLFKAGIAVSIKAITYIPKNEPGCGLTALQADFTYSISPDTIAIIDTTLGKRSVTNDIENVLRRGCAAWLKMTERGALTVRSTDKGLAISTINGTTTPALNHRIRSTWPLRS